MVDTTLPETSPVASGYLPPTGTFALMHLPLFGSPSGVEKNCRMK